MQVNAEQAPLKSTRAESTNSSIYSIWDDRRAIEVIRPLRSLHKKAPWPPRAVSDHASS